MSVTLAHSVLSAWNSLSPCLLGELLFIHSNPAHMLPPYEIFMTSLKP